MSKAILEIETPQSCRMCPITRIINCKEGHDILDLNGQYIQCPEIRATWDDSILFKNKRNPDCPLKITKENLRWQGNGTETIGYYITCPECKKEPHGNWDREEFSDDDFPNYCPSCGIKLLPPEGL